MKKLSIIALSLMLIFALASCDVVAGEVDKLVTEATAPLVETIETLEATKTELENAKSTLETAKATLEEAKTKLEAEKAALKETKAKLESEKATLEETKAKLESEKATLEGEMSQLEYDKDYEIYELNKEIADLEEYLDASKNEIDEAEAKILTLVECLKGNHVYDTVTFDFFENSYYGDIKFDCTACGLDYVYEAKAHLEMDYNTYDYYITADFPIPVEDYPTRVDFVGKCSHESQGILTVFKSYTYKHKGEYDDWYEECQCIYCYDEYHEVGEDCRCATCDETFHQVGDDGETCAICSKSLAVASITVDGVKQNYVDFNDALQAAEEIPGATIVLEADVYLKGSVAIDGNGMIIDFNGHSVYKSKSASYAYFYIYTDLTFKDSVGGSVCEVDIDVSSGTLMIMSGKYNNVGTGSEAATIRISGGSIARLGRNMRGSKIELSGGSIDFLISYNYGDEESRIESFLADGYCYYDVDGNVVDSDDIITDDRYWEGWYLLYNVTVAPIN